MPKIALVDDDQNILASVSMTLKAEGYAVSTYTDGASGLEGLTTDTPDLAILDIKMPRMDGMELLRRLRQKSDLPVIFLTSKDDEIDELFGLKMGADDFITKPFSQRLLVERVKAILRRANARAEGANGAASETENKKVDFGTRSSHDGPRASCLRVGRQKRHANSDRVFDPFRPCTTPWRCEKPRQLDGRGL